MNKQNAIDVAIAVTNHFIKGNKIKFHLCELLQKTVEHLQEFDFQILQALIFGFA